jgi:hypothetical protein
MSVSCCRWWCYVFTYCGWWCYTCYLVYGVVAILATMWMMMLLSWWCYLYIWWSCYFIANYSVIKLLFYNQKQKTNGEPVPTALPCQIVGLLAKTAASFRREAFVNGLGPQRLCRWHCRRHSIGLLLAYVGPTFTCANSYLCRRLVLTVALEYGATVEDVPTTRCPISRIS